MVAPSAIFRRNILALWGAFAVRIALAFVFVPCITESLGAARYGVWGILFQIINYLALLDFGFEKAIINFVATCLGRGDREGVSRVINTSGRLYFWFGIAAVILTAGAAWLVLPYLKVDSPSLLVESQWALVLIGLFAGIRFWFVPVTASLGGFQRYDSLTIIGVAEDIARTIVMILLLKSGAGLVPLAATVLGFGILRQIVSLWWLKRIFPEWRLSTTTDQILTKSLFDYSKITFGITLAWMVIFNTDSLLLGFFASASAAGIFNPATQLAGYIRHLVNAVGTPLTAAVAHAKGAQEMSAATTLYLKLFRYASYGGFAVLGLVAIYAQPVVSLWLPAGFEDTARVMIILAVGSAVFVPHILSNSMLFAVNKHRLLFYTVVGEAALKLLLAIILIRPMGAVGIALANAIPQLVCYLGVYPFFVSQAVSVGPIDLLWGQCRSAVIATIFTLIPGYLLSTLFAVDGWLALALSVGATLLCGGIGLLLVLTGEDRNRLRALIKQQR